MVTSICSTIIVLIYIRQDATVVELKLTLFNITGIVMEKMRLIVNTKTGSSIMENNQNLITDREFETHAKVVDNRSPGGLRFLIDAVEIHMKLVELTSVDACDHEIIDVEHKSSAGQCGFVVLVEYAAVIWVGYESERFQFPTEIVEPGQGSLHAAVEHFVELHHHAAVWF
jgi:hypothetical protein